MLLLLLLLMPCGVVVVVTVVLVAVIVVVMVVVVVEIEDVDELWKMVKLGLFNPFSSTAVCGKMSITLSFLRIC